ncbi:WD domain repeat-containing protein 55 [Coemansia sp. RSA 2703]|nr:WD domain repeat-containing protein 55 [Coemansia sp. RSA 2703]
MDDTAVRPKSLKFKEPVIDVALCPTNNIVATSLITGHVFVHKYSVDGNERLFRQKVHKKSCRSVCFSDDGALLYTASKDRSWQAIDVETGVQKMCVDGAHEKSVNLIRYVNEQIVATGDDTGAVKLWDTRKNKPAFAYNEHVDYISDMVFNAEKRHLLATSGDGCLSVYDVRKAKPYQVSANQDDELLSIALMRGGKKVVVGETDGVLGIFSYDQFGDVSDRFPGHPQSIDTICKLTEDMCVTGSSDGLLRIVQLFPHKLVGVAGDHDSLPVEKVVLSHDKQWLASCSHDHTVHFWDIGYIFDDSGDADNDSKDGSDESENEDDEVDVQATAIRISKAVGTESSVDSDCEVDIDGCSDAGELRDRGADGIEGATGAETDTDAEADIRVDVDDADSDGWGDSDDSTENKPAKKKRKMTKAEKRKARRLAAAELSNPAAAATKGKKEKAKSKTPFFTDL